MFSGRLHAWAVQNKGNTMRQRFDLILILSSSLGLAATGCAVEPDHDDGSTTTPAGLLSCGIGGPWLAAETLTPASIPSLSALRAAQIVEAVRESAHTDVTTVEEAFDRVDQHEINVRTMQLDGTGQFYVEIEYGAGDNSYGAIFYWGTAVKAAAIHDGFQEECGPLVFNYDQGDTAPACAGFLDYANTASFAALDAFLPSNVAQAIVDARAIDPFDSVASVVAVNGVAEYRLQQLLTAARNAGLVGPSCSGIYDQIAASVDEATATVALVNETSRTELDGALAFLINHTVNNTLLAERPFADATELAATAGVGPAVFRALRNRAPIRGPFEELVDELNEIDHPDGQIRLDLHFDWLPLVTAPDYGLTSMTCFGIDPALLPPEATLRPTLGDGNEVMENVGEAVAIANRFGELDVDPTPGLSDLEYRTTGADFLGCYINYHPNPWVYDRTTFFVDLDTGFGVQITSHYVE
jgi:hypothetical protein